MAFICTRCEADEHPNLTKSQMRNIAADVDSGYFRDIHTVTTVCEGCSSNTVHVSDGGDTFNG